ncbi:MAG TPA: hypothetical protein VNF24_07620 [Candidatus Acidoferrales bacterium]|nr:hypothetical protein [Candidatus Acidoferrales bacterium]
MLIVASDQEKVEVELQTGRLACPPCGGELRPWGHGRGRVLRRRQVGKITSECDGRGAGRAW